ncbi:phospholipid-transporting ATPase 1 [Nannizzia gypsea CBS 118893]|uniref:Phospholipid-transporting ATPase n=1 Tax=Arthroderma gypseum (strain ATCC MYA-4604 / CBS 118893) TaxID=535722 RepID=E5QYQ7_ARTGP|nr:phospholipid-transporting ATPase 1 [Nannizzia gypsea CBS 118893]EFQ97245.1 phospholipid-transporting ATPase 1 [Nannizzia gypsea CBS 118893]
MPTNSYAIHSDRRSIGSTDDDDDLELEELGVHSSPRFSDHDRHRRPSDGSRWYSPAVPLKKLRQKTQKRPWERDIRQSGEEDDLDGLLYDHEHEEPRLSRATISSADDDSPLLTTGERRPLSRESSGQTRSGLRSMLGLPMFGNRGAMTTGGLLDRLKRPGSNKTANTIPPREILVGQGQKSRYPPNVVSNAKYTPWSFLPRTLYNEFSFFFNIYFLLVALSQTIPILRIGYISSYIAPLSFVVFISLSKEALDDISRRRRDAEANSEEYNVISFERSSFRTPGLASSKGQTPNWPEPIEITKKSKDLKVGDILKVGKDRRLPADVIILKSLPTDSSSNPESDAEYSVPYDTSQEHGASEANRGDIPSDAAGSAETFIRTDQLDGETDWKLRLASPLTQSLALAELNRIRITASSPAKNVNEFVGKIELAQPPSEPYDPAVEQGGKQDGYSSPTQSAPLSIDNAAWANTVLASNTITYAAVIYTGSQTRSALSTSASRSKVGLLEHEINSLTKILCVLTLTLSVTLVALEGFEPTNDKEWYIAIMIYLILFSTIIPMSLRVNLDMAKTVYGRFIERDKGIPGTIVRTSTIPEDLGRIEYLLSDKTGTLTQNEMELKKIHVGTVSYANEAMEEVASFVRQGFSASSSAGGNELLPFTSASAQTSSGPATRTRREISSRVRDLILALALCHNVTPTKEEENGEIVTTYQASSPDEIAIVKYTEEVGLKLSHRDRQSIILTVGGSGISIKAKILDIFPFTSESKRMGIIVQFSADQYQSGPTQLQNEIWFFQKGADTVMSSIVSANDWLDEETANMAREGLRTLVVGRKKLTSEHYGEFSKSYKEASMSLNDRDSLMTSVAREYLERDLELLGVTGVEDKLQKDVKPSLELLRNAGIKIWMLTGDKVETARCVAVSSKLVSRGQVINTVTKLKDADAANDALDFLRNKTESCLLIDGESLGLMLSQFRIPFITLAVRLPAVIACRCSPMQKAEIATLIRQHTKKRICCIGDGGNDVSMIQAADVGIGIVGKEGRQASLAADFSITHFHHLTKLLFWHGRNSYKRSAKLAQFVMHRGLIISACQTMFSIASRFDPKGLFINWLLVGYATIYTNAPVFSLVLDRDVDEGLANLYPELYKELKSGKSLSYKSFFTWVLVSVYQGAVIEGLAQILVGEIAGPRLVSVSFTALVLNELIMVAVAITTWHPVMIMCIVGTAIVYGATVPFLGDYYDLAYVVTWGWAWKVVAICAVSLIPVWAVKLISRTWSPPSYRKVRG